jgi:hypothetical protein
MRKFLNTVDTLLKVAWHLWITAFVGFILLTCWVGVGVLISQEVSFGWLPMLLVLLVRSLVILALYTFVFLVLEEVYIG